MTDYKYLEIVHGARGRAEQLDSLLEKGKNSVSEWKQGLESAQDALDTKDTNEKYDAVNNVVLRAILFDAAKVYSECASYLKEDMAAYMYSHRPCIEAVLKNTNDTEKVVVRYNAYDETEINAALEGFQDKINTYCAGVMEAVRSFGLIFKEGRPEEISAVKEKMENLHIFLLSEKLFKPKVFDNTGFVPKETYLINARDVLLKAGSALEQYASYCSGFSERLDIFAKKMEGLSVDRSFFELSPDCTMLYNNFITCVRYASTKLMALIYNMSAVAKISEANWKELNQAVQKEIVK